jgi:hypothetical protein
MGMILRAIESYQKAITILSDAEEESLPLAQVLNNLGLA